jgi:hypothetical protein
MPDLGIGSQIAPQALKTLEQATADDPLERIELQLPAFHGEAHRNVIAG